MASLPDPAFTKPIIANCNDHRRTPAGVPILPTTSKLPQNGITPTLRTRLQTYLSTHKHAARLRLCCTLPQQGPATEQRERTQDSQAYSQWNDITTRARHSKPHRYAPQWIFVLRNTSRVSRHPILFLHNPTLCLITTERLLLLVASPLLSIVPLT